MTKQTKLLAVAGKDITCTFWTPAPAQDRKKAVIVAYGSYAMEGDFGRMIEQFCEGLSRAGYFVALPAYFECSGTTPGMNAALSTNATFDKWISCMSVATLWARTQTGTSAAALIGFSLGGNLVLKSALAFTVDAVVDFFGPLTLFEDAGSHALTQSRIASLPRTQIHHGKADTIVPPKSSSEILLGWLSVKGVKHEAHLDYECGHPGDRVPPQWNADAERKSLERTITFLNNSL
jgi:dienelactone hydrolase